MRNIEVYRQVHSNDLAKVMAFGLESKARYIERKEIQGLAKTPRAAKRQRSVLAGLYHPEFVYPVYTLFSFWVDDEENHIGNGWIWSSPKKFEQSTMTIAEYLDKVKSTGGEFWMKHAFLRITCVFDAPDDPVGPILKPHHLLANLAPRSG